jgi:hypothetical protein
MGQRHTDVQLAGTGEGNIQMPRNSPDSFIGALAASQLAILKLILSASSKRAQNARCTCVFMESDCTIISRELKRISQAAAGTSKAPNACTGHARSESAPSVSPREVQTSANLKNFSTCVSWSVWRMRWLTPTSTRLPEAPFWRVKCFPISAPMPAESILGNVREIDYQGGRRVCPHHGLEIEEVGDKQRALEPENSFAIPGTGNVFYRQWVRFHVGL